MKHMKELTIRDVAQKAGVSVATVSRVLNSNVHVSEETRNIVQNVINQTGYIPSSIAVSMKTRQTNLIVVLVPDLETFFYAQLVKGVERIIGEAGYLTLVFSAQGKAHGEEEFLSSAFVNMIDGIVAIPSMEKHEPYNRFAKPLVMVDRFIEGCNRDTIAVDNYMGSYTLTEHLIHYGHRRIAVITGPIALNVGVERMLGYRQALSNNGIAQEDELCFIGEWNSAHGLAATVKILQLENRATAIYAANATILEGVLQALSKYRIKIPDDISVVAFDNPPISQMIEPHITVIDRPAEIMGVFAAQLLLQRIRNEGDSGFKRKVFSIELIERQSVKKILNNID